MVQSLGFRDLMVQGLELRVWVLHEPRSMKGLEG